MDLEELTTQRLLLKVLDELVGIRAWLSLYGQVTPSSVEIKTSTRGVDIATKAYSGSPIEPAGDAAMDEFIRVGQELQRRLMGQANQAA